MTAIAAIDQNRGLGRNGALLFHIHADLQRFRALTLGRAIVYGRKTLQTFPGEKPLPGRQNYILTHDPAFHCPDAVTCSSIEALLQTVPSPDDLIVVGGASVYRQLEPYTTRLYATEVRADAGADCFLFPLTHWHPIETAPWQEEKGLTYCFVTYEKKRHASEDFRTDEGFKEESDYYEKLLRD